jgi:glycosyltransferase involved in cell wall biosynthesis
MSKPYITALIDTYNQGRFIEEAIASVLAQDFPQAALEIIVVDDGSTDDTAARVKRFGDRVRYIHKKNGGQASAFNAGFAAARGEIIALLDGDDLWLPGKIRRVAETFEDNPEAVMVYHPFEYWNAPRDLVSKDEGFRAISGKVVEDAAKLLQFGSLSTSGLAFRRGPLQKLLPVPETLTILADGYLGYLAIFLGPVAGLGEYLTRYRIHGGNLCSFENSTGPQLKRRAQCSADVAAAIPAWLIQNGHAVKDPKIAAYIRRHELVAERVGFTASAPGRLEFARHLRSWNRVYGAIWSPAYRLFRSTVAGLGFVLGYRGFQRAEQLYRRAHLAALRQKFFSAHDSRIVWTGAVPQSQLK